MAEFTACTLAQTAAMAPVRELPFMTTGWRGGWDG